MESRELASDDRVVTLQQLAPRSISESRRTASP